MEPSKERFVCTTHTPMIMVPMPMLALKHSLAVTKGSMIQPPT